jgi:hypothetical protein
MSDQPQTSEVSKFFSDYTRLFDAKDGAAIATCYHAPSISELQEFFQAVAEKYYEEGQRASRYANLDVKPIGSKSALATLDWQMLREDGSTIRTWRQSYNLIRQDGRWQILVSTIHI